jgi:hypothetical protein
MTNKAYGHLINRNNHLFSETHLVESQSYKVDAICVRLDSFCNPPTLTSCQELKAKFNISTEKYSEDAVMSYHIAG